jgi:hypothetical protein
VWFYGKKKEPGRSVPAKPGTGVFSLVHSWALQEHRLDCADSWRSRLSRRAPFLLHNCYMSRQPGQLCSLSAPFLLHRVQQPEPLRQRRTRSWNIKEMSDIACGYWQLLVLFLTVTTSYKAEAMFDICPTHESSARSEASAFATDLDVLGFWQLASRKCPSNTRAWRSAL